MCILENEIAIDKPALLVVMWHCKEFLTFSHFDVLKWSLPVVQPNRTFLHLKSNFSPHN